MKINEVEKIIGIAKKNIRFYEKEGLLAPRRNRENGYRDYGDDDIKSLEQIKLLRKLGIPIEEIRLLQRGGATVADVMKRHIVTLERTRRNISHSIDFCSALKAEDKLLGDLNIHELLSSIEAAENKGASFNNIHIKDVKPIRYAGAVIASSVMIILMAVVFFILILAFKYEDNVPPLPFQAIILFIPIIVTIGVIYSLIQRIGEIKKGEADDAKRF